MFKKAEKKRLKLRLALMGPSGSGKTFTALKIATGLVGDPGKIAVIDTESDSASLYEDAFEFDVAVLSPPYTPEKFIEYLKLAETSGYDCAIMDSISHEWKGAGGVLDIQSQATGKNSFTTWGKITPRHEKFLQAILASPIHVIVTMRSKPAYVLEERKGKQVPVKVGLQPVQRDDIEHEFTTAFSLDMDHIATTIKDRTNLFPVSVPFPPDETTGIKLAEWLNKGKKGKRITVSSRIKQLHECGDLEELQALFQNILKTRKSYSEGELNTLIATKDRVKEKLLDPPLNDGHEDDAQEPTTPKKTPTPKQQQKPDEPEERHEQVELHEDVAHLQKIFNNDAYKSVFDELFKDDAFDGHEIRNCIDTNNAKRAAEITVMVDEKIG